MNIETLQLMIEAGPNAVSMLGYYVLSGVGTWALFFGAVLTGIKMVIGGIEREARWCALSRKEKNMVALKKAGLLPKDFNPKVYEVCED